MRARLLTVLATLLLFTLTAHADTKSWTAVKGKIPAGTDIVVGIDVSQIAKTSLFATALTQFFTEEQDAKQGFDAVKTACAIDVTTAVTDVTILANDKSDSALIAIGVTGIDQAKASSCLQTILDLDKKGEKITAKTKGKVTEYSITGKDKKLYVAWLTKDVVAITSDPFAKGMLTKMIAGKAPKGDLKTFIGKTTPTSAVFAAVAKKDSVPDVGTVKGGFGFVDIAAGSISVKGSVVMSSAAEATKMAAAANSELQKAVKELGTKSPDLGKALGAATINAAGTEVGVSGSITEKLLQAIIPQLDKIL